MPEVRLIGEDGQQVGVLKTDDALRYAQERDLDLVEVAPEARPPVCRVLDYSKYKYEQAQKLKQARKHQQQITVREIKFRPKIAQHDYDTKKGHVERFLRHQDKVKITIMFRGREVTHPERGVAILERLAEELAELAVVEQRPAQDGRNMTMMLGPSRGRAGRHGRPRARPERAPHRMVPRPPTPRGAGARRGSHRCCAGPPTASRRNRAGRRCCGSRAGARGRRGSPAKPRSRPPAPPPSTPPRPTASRRRPCGLEPRRRFSTPVRAGAGGQPAPRPALPRAGSAASVCHNQPPACPR